MDDRCRSAPDPGTLEPLLAEALDLARRTRDLLVTADRPAARGDAGPLAALVRAAEIGRITTRLTASVAWLLGRRAVAAGELDPEAARDPHWRLLPLPGPEAPSWPVDDPEIARLARRSAALYARLQRLDAALDSAPPVRH